MNFFNESKHFEVKGNNWDTRLEQLQGKGVMTTESDIGYEIVRPAVDFLSFDANKLEQLRTVFQHGAVNELAGRIRPENAVAADKIKDLMEVTTVSEIQKIQQHLKSIDDWWTLTLDKKIAVVSLWKEKPLPDSMLDSIAFKSGLSNKHDWLDAAFMNRMAYLAVSLRPALQAMKQENTSLN
jgi:hypothetical protein